MQCVNKLQNCPVAISCLPRICQTFPNPRCGLVRVRINRKKAKPQRQDNRRPCSNYSRLFSAKFFLARYHRSVSFKVPSRLRDREMEKPKKRINSLDAWIPKTTQNTFAVANDKRTSMKHNFYRFFVPLPCGGGSHAPERNLAATSKKLS